jgi:hypothetical protein
VSHSIYAPCSAQDDYEGSDGEYDESEIPAHVVAEAHFGGPGEHKKSRREIMSEVCVPGVVCARVVCCGSTSRYSAVQCSAVQVTTLSTHPPPRPPRPLLLPLILPPLLPLILPPLLPLLPPLQIIAKSKLAKYERQQEKEEDDEAREALGMVMLLLYLHSSYTPMETFTNTLSCPVTGMDCGCGVLLCSGCASV